MTITTPEQPQQPTAAVEVLEEIELGATTKEEETKEEEEAENDVEQEEEPDIEVSPTPTTTATTTIPRFPFPKAFYDPHTNKIMTNPVVDRDGLSYEAPTVEDLETGTAATQYYPNRALQAYIEEELDRFADAGSLRGTLLQWGQSLRNNWQQLLEKSALPAGEYRPLPDAFYCPISFDLIHEPVIDPDGHTFEKAAIYYWLQNNSDSPVTRNPLTVEQLRENKALLSVLEYLTAPEEEEQVHPSVRKWKTEHSTRVPFVPPPPTTANTDGAANNATTNGAPTNNYASNQEELDALRRRRKIYSDRLWTAWSFAFLIVVFFFPSYVLLFILITVAIYLVEKVYCVRRDIRDRRDVVLAQQQQVAAAQAALLGETTTTMVVYPNNNVDTAGGTPGGTTAAETEMTTEGAVTTTTTGEAAAATNTTAGGTVMTETEVEVATTTTGEVAVATEATVSTGPPTTTTPTTTLATTH